MLRESNVLTKRNDAQQTHVAGTITAPCHTSTSVAESQRTETKLACVLSVAPSNLHPIQHHAAIKKLKFQPRMDNENDQNVLLASCGTDHFVQLLQFSFK